MYITPRKQNVKVGKLSDNTTRSVVYKPATERLNPDLFLI